MNKAAWLLGLLAPFATSCATGPRIPPAGSGAQALAPSPQAPTLPGDAHAFRFHMPTVPAPSAARAPLPAANEFRLRNGVRVVVQENHRLPLWAAALVFAGGSLADPVGKEGLATVCMAAWLPETSVVETQLLSSLLADLGVTMAATSGDGYSLITMRGPAWNHAEALRLLQHVALPNRWMTGPYARALARAKQRLKLALKSAAADVERQATRLLRAALLGDAVADARPPTNASIDAITARDCAEYQARHLTADHLTIAVAGDVDAAALELELGRDRQVRNAAFIHLPTSRAASPRMAGATSSAAPPPLSIVFLHVPEAAQTQVAVGHLGPAATAGAYLPTLVAMQALGGAGGGRLVANLRETKGFGYYAKYVATTTEGGTAFGLHASVEPGAAWITALEILRARRDIALNAPIGAAELATIVINRTQLVYEAFAKPQAWISSFIQTHRLGLPLGYMSREVEELAELSPNEVYATMQRALKTPTTVVIVGDGNAPQYAPALIPGWNPRVVRMRAGKPVVLRDALMQWAAQTGATFREVAR